MIVAQEKRRDEDFRSSGVFYQGKENREQKVTEILANNRENSLFPTVLFSLALIFITFNFNFLLK